MAPHGYCLLWDPLLIWGSVVSDALIALSYFVIPAALIRIVHRRSDTRFGWLFSAFALFILACGTSHLMHIWNLWHGDYGAEVVVKVVTAAISVVTAIILWILSPRIIALPSSGALRRVNADLMAMIEERDDALARLEAEISVRAAAQADAQILRVSRLSATGAMASTIAHELNQPLTALANYLAVADQLSNAHDIPREGLREAIRKARGQANRANEIIRRMRAFTKRGELARKPENPAEFVETALHALQDRLERDGVDVRIEIAPALPPVSADRLQMEQVLINLYRNALDAMSDIPDKILEIAARADADQILISVSDSGPGIDEADLPKIFQLLQSSKDDGLGLGLPLCRSIVEAHGGRIWAEKSPLGGARFVVALDRDDAAMPAHTRPSQLVTADDDRPDTLAAP